MITQKQNTDVFKVIDNKVMLNGKDVSHLKVDYSKDLKDIKVGINVNVKHYRENYPYDNGTPYYVDSYESEFGSIDDVEILGDSPHDWLVAFIELTPLERYLKDYDYDCYDYEEVELVGVEIDGEWYVY